MVRSLHCLRFVPRADICGATARLLDHLVGAGLQGQRDCEAERVCGLEIDHRPEFDRHLNGQLDGVYATEDTIDISGCSTKYVCGVRSIREQPSVSREGSVKIDGGYLVSGGRLDNRLSVGHQKRITNGDKSASRLATKRSDGRFDFRIVVNRRGDCP